MDCQARRELQPRQRHPGVPNAVVDQGHRAQTLEVLWRHTQNLHHPELHLAPPPLPEAKIRPTPLHDANMRQRPTQGLLLQRRLRSHNLNLIQFEN